jgi:hypothetical protein
MVYTIFDKVFDINIGSHYSILGEPNELEGKSSYSVSNIGLLSLVAKERFEIILEMLSEREVV